MELLNGDIIYIICAHMDLTTIASFASAYPQWKSLAYRTIQKKRWGIKVTSRSGCSVVEYCSLENDPKAITSTSRSEEDIAFNMVSKLESGKGTQLPRFAWRLVPFYLMKIYNVRVYQNKLHFEPDELFDEVRDVLARIKTRRLFLQSDNEHEVNKLLRAMYFRPKSKVCLRMKSPMNSKIPLFQECNFSNVVEFHWSTNRMLARDVSFLLQSNIDSLYLEAPHLGPHGVSIIQQYVQNQSDRVHFQKLMRGQGLLESPSYEYRIGITYSEHFDSFTISCFHCEDLICKCVREQ